MSVRRRARRSTTAAAGADARPARSLARTAYVRGRPPAVRRPPGPAPSLGRELGTLAGCLGHVIRRRCPAGTDDGRSQRRAPSEGSASGTRPRRKCGGTADAAGMSTGRPAGGRRREERASRGRGLPVRARAEPWAASTRCAAACKTRWSNAWELTSGRRLRLELAARHRPPLRQGARARGRASGASTLAEAMRAELLQLPPRRGAAHVPARRAGEVRKPQPAARRASARGITTGCW